MRRINKKYKTLCDVNECINEKIRWRKILIRFFLSIVLVLFSLHLFFSKLNMSAASGVYKNIEHSHDLFTFLSFLNHVIVGGGFPPEDIQRNFCVDPAGITEPSV